MYKWVNMSPKCYGFMCFMCVFNKWISVLFSVRGSPSYVLQLMTCLWTNQRRKLLNWPTWPHLLTAWCPSDNRQTGAASDVLNSMMRHKERLVLNVVILFQVPFKCTNVLNAPNLFGVQFEFWSPKWPLDPTRSTKV